MERKLNIPEIRPYEPVNTYVKRIADANAIDINVFYEQILLIHAHPSFIFLPLDQLSKITGIGMEELKNNHTIFPAIRFFTDAAEGTQIGRYLSGEQESIPRLARFTIAQPYFNTIQEEIKAIPEVNSSNTEFVQGLLMNREPMNVTGFGTICLLHALFEKEDTPILRYYSNRWQSELDPNPSIILSDAIDQFQKPQCLLDYAGLHLNVIQYSLEPIRVCATLTALADNLGYDIVARLSYGINGLIYRTIVSHYQALENKWLQFLKKKAEDPNLRNGYYYLASMTI